MGASSTIEQEARDLIQEGLRRYQSRNDADSVEDRGSAWSSSFDPIDNTYQDNEIESYPTHHVLNSSKTGDGVQGVDAPLHIEHVMAVTTLLRSGFACEDLESSELNAAINLLSHELGNSGGKPGLAGRLSGDVGETSQRIMILGILEPTRVQSDVLEQMIDIHEVECHTQSHVNVYDTSYITSCNVLLALLHHPKASQYLTSVFRITEFLCNAWWATDGSTGDETNTCHLYPYLLSVNAFTDLLSWASENEILAILENNLITRVRISLFQACLRTMLVQDADGSWGSSVEETAYGILILSEARRVSFTKDLEDHIHGAVERGVHYLKIARDRSPLGHPGNERLQSSSPFLIQAYKLAASRVSTRPLTPADTQYRSNENEKTASAHLKLIQQTPLFSKTPTWQILASLIEATLFRPLLRELRLRTFPREGMEADKYFDIIPFTWTACNNRRRAFASTSLLFDMMVISFLNYQADEFMEAVAGPEFHGDLSKLRNLIDGLFIEVDEPPSGASKVREPLTRFVAHVLRNPTIQTASSWDRKHVKRRLRTFLLAHVTQTEDNSRFTDTQIQGAYTEAQDSFFHWVRTTTADHTSCPYAFAFISCLIASSVAPGQDCFPTTTQKYLAESMCWRLATMCRMYNDYGSVERDKLEGNLNSVNFPEFHLSPNKKQGTTGSAEVEDGRKDTLLALAEYERRDLEEIVTRLDCEIDSADTSAKSKNRGRRKMALFRMFIDVTDLYGQIYVIRDIASRMKNNASNGGIANGREPC
ncbi:hypothetical protein GGR50DRAFT_696083 [Xylaria sp. CBS 124048]|nr:hypothetical protein GGR50DRAFT_696083 [Xylaria sp. CBS 124048]